MARGPSGRIVIELNPALKRELHAALAADGVTLKDWFTAQARTFVAERRQPPLPGIGYRVPDEPLRIAAEEPPKYGTAKRGRRKAKKE